MAVTAALFGLYFTSLHDEEIDIAADDINVALATSSYTPDQDTHDYFNDVTNEVTGTGYTAGGDTLGSKTQTYTAGTNKWVFDAADAQWTSSTITARYAVIYDATGGGTDATRPLIGYQNFGADVSTTSGTFDLAWAAGGIVEITVGAEA